MESRHDTYSPLLTISLVTTSLYTRSPSLSTVHSLSASLYTSHYTIHHSLLTTPHSLTLITETLIFALLIEIDKYSLHTRTMSLLFFETKKRGLCAFANKRFLLDDGIHTLAYGHKDITTKVESI